MTILTKYKISTFARPDIPLKFKWGVADGQMGISRNVPERFAPDDPVNMYQLRVRRVQKSTDLDLSFSERI